MSAASQSAVLAIFFEFHGTSKNQLQPGQESMRDAPVLSQYSLPRNP